MAPRGIYVHVTVRVFSRTVEPSRGYYAASYHKLSSAGASPLDFSRRDTVSDLHIALPLQTVILSMLWQLAELAPPH